MRQTNDVGSLIHSTAKLEDIFPELIDTASRLLHCEDCALTAEENGRAQSLLGEIERRLEDANYFYSDEAFEDYDRLEELLNMLAPEGYYFGSHPGDGCDYGFWEIEG